MKQQIVNIEEHRRGALFTQVKILSRYSRLVDFYPHFCLQVPERQLQRLAGYETMRMHFDHYFAEIRLPLDLWSSVRLVDRLTGNMIANGIVCEIVRGRSSAAPPPDAA